MQLFAPRLQTSTASCLLIEHRDKVDISIDPFTARNPSYCFVFFQDEIAAQKAIDELDGRDFLGRTLKIGPCYKKIENEEYTTSLATTQKRWCESDVVDFDNENCSRDIVSDTKMMGFVGPVQEGRRIKICGLPRPQSQHDSDLAIQGLFEGFEV